jgi:vacuolar-type H+-ATPase subunit H
MKWVVGIFVVAVLTLPSSRGEEPKKEPSAKEQYDALIKEFSAKQREIIAAVNKAKGPEQQKLIESYRAIGKEFAEKFYKLIESDPKSTVAADAAFWIVQNASGSPAYQKAADKVEALIAEMPMTELSEKINRIPVNPAVVDAVLKRAEKDEKDPKSADLIAWAATRASFLLAGQKAAQTLLEKYPDHVAIDRILAGLARSRSPETEKTLRKFAESASKPNVRSAATLALARLLANRVDSLGNNPAEADKVAVEAEKQFAAAIDLLKDDATQTAAAERELKTLRTIRVGKEAPEIKAGDLDGKEFKLSDYRGKVVLLDFWGHW